MFAFTRLLVLGIAGGVSLNPATTTTTISLTNPSRQTCNLVFRNDTKKTIEIWQSGFWPNHRVTMQDSGGKPVPLTSPGKTGAARFGSPNRDKNAPFEIKAGKSYSYATPPLPSAFELKPGKYTLSVVYEDKSFGKPLKLTCTGIKITVVR
jgi:hypothetical protein